MFSKIEALLSIGKYGVMCPTNLYIMLDMSIVYGW